MDSDDDSSGDVPMPQVPLQNPISNWLNGNNFEDLQEPFGLTVLDESTDKLVRLVNKSRGVYLCLEIQSLHIGHGAYLPKPVYGYISRIEETAEHIKELVEAAGWALPTPVDVSKCSLSRRKTGRPNSFPPELLDIAKST